MTVLLCKPLHFLIDLIDSTDTTVVFLCLFHRRSLPIDLAEGALRALCLQALGQVESLSMFGIY